MARMARRGIAFASLCIAFFGVGAANASFGPLLPELAARNGLPLAQAGLIVSFIFFGVGVANPIAGVLSDRFGRGPILLFGILCTGAFAVGISASRSAPLLLALSFGMGMGGGIVVLGTNLLVVDLFGERSVSPINLVNMFFGLGAVTGPALASLTWRWCQTALPALLFAILLMYTQLPVLAILQRRLFSTLRATGSRPDASADEASASPQVSGRSIFRSPLLWVFGAVVLFDLGMEQSLNGWTAVYMHRSTGIGMANAALVVSAFWIAFTIGRLAAASIANRISARALLSGSLLAGAAGVALINLSADTISLSVAGFMFIGLGFGPIFPTVVAGVGNAFGRAAGTATGVVLMLGTVGGIIFVWLEGLVLEESGTASAAHLLIAMLLAVMICLALADIFGRIAGRKGEPSRP